MQVDGFAVLTFLFTLYMMIRCTHHSYCVFTLHLSKWKNQRTPQPLRQRNSIPLPLTASLWLFLASSLFCTCCALNFCRLFTVAQDYLIFTRIFPFLYSSGVLLSTLAASVTGLFWAEVALNQCGRTEHSFKMIKRYCALVSLVFASVFAVLYLFFGYGTFAKFFMVVPLVSTVIVCVSGACLIQRELGKLQGGVRTVQRVLTNIREAACKILVNAVATIIISLAYIVFESKPNTAPVLLHLLLIIMYANINLTIIAIGQYLASQKVRSVPLWALARIQTKWQSFLDGSLFHGGRRNDSRGRRRVIPVAAPVAAGSEQEEEAIRGSAGNLAGGLQDNNRHQGSYLSAAMRSLLGFPSLSGTSSLATMDGVGTERRLERRGSLPAIWEEHVNNDDDSVDKVIIMAHK